MIFLPKLKKQTSDNITDLDIDEAEMRKRRHESGESTDSGLGEASTPKKTRMEDVFDKDEVQVTAEMINEKLDKVLKVVEELRDEKVFVKPVTKHDAPVEMPNWIKQSRPMKEIEEAGFAYDEVDGVLSCTVCKENISSGKFYYSADHGLKFDDDEYMPKVFSSLKRNIVCHVHSSKSHTDAITEIEEKKQKESELKSKNYGT